jgi:hypothetical protein
MNLEQMIIPCMNFFYTYKYLSIAVLVGLGVLSFLKPKQMLKGIMILGACFIVAYLLYYIGGATVTGVSQKGTLIHKSR